MGHGHSDSFQPIFPASGHARERDGKSGDKPFAAREACIHFSQIDHASLADHREQQTAGGSV